MTEEEAWKLSKLAWWDEARRKKSFREKIWLKTLKVYTKIWFWNLMRKREVYSVLNISRRKDRENRA